MYRFLIRSGLLLAAGIILGALYAGPSSEPEILLENDLVRVRKVILEPGVENPEHTHDLPHVGVITKGGTLEFFEAGDSETVHFKNGQAGWRDAGVTHRIVNRSSEAVHVVEVEIKSSVE